MTPATFPIPVGRFKIPPGVPESVVFLLDRLDYIEAAIGTLTDRPQLACTELSTLDGCDIWPQDLATFKRIVERGIMKSANFKPPNGYEILNFLTLLCHLQEEKRERDWQKERDEMNRLFKTMPEEKQNEFRAWTKSHKHTLTDSQTFQLYKNQ